MIKRKLKIKIIPPSDCYERLGEVKVGDYINWLCWGPGGHIYCGGEAGLVSKLADINYT